MMIDVNQLSFAHNISNVTKYESCKTTPTMIVDKNSSYLTKLVPISAVSLPFCR